MNATNQKKAQPDLSDLRKFLQTMAESYGGSRATSQNIMAASVILERSITEHAALCAVAEAARMAVNSGPLRNGMRDDNSLALIDDALTNLAAVRGQK